MSTTPNHVENIVAAVELWLTDGDSAALQSAYRAIPAAARGAAGIAAYKAAGSRMADVLDLFENLPSTTTSRVVERLSDERVAAIRSTLSAVVAAATEAFLTNPDAFPTETPIADGIERTFADRAIAASLAAIERVTVGDRATELDLSGMIARGMVAAGDILTHGDHRAIVNADGSVNYNGSDMTVSAAARAAAGSGAENGYRYWSNGDQTLRTIRANG